MSAAWRPGKAQVDAAEASAQLASIALTTAAGRLAEAVLDLDQETIDALPSEVRVLVRSAADARAEATYRWAAYADVLAQFNGANG